MPILKNIELEIGVDDVLRAQGMDPALIHDRRPAIYDFAQQAVIEGYPLLEPKVVYERYHVTGRSQDRLNLEGGRHLEGALFNEHLDKAEEVVGAICTVGDKFSKPISDAFQNNPAQALALEGFASVAAEILGNAFCSFIEEMAAKEGVVASIPFNPGLIGWSVEEGQPQVFALVDASSIGVILDPSCFMRPMKTVSMVIGLGHHLQRHQKQCDLCSLQETCIYRKQKVIPGKTP